MMRRLMFITLLLTSSTALAGTLTVYAIPSPHGINWASPKTLSWSALTNQASPQTHTIGHANIHLRCQTEDGDMRDFELLTGMTSGANDPTNQLLTVEGYGLGILFTTIPGRLETQSEVSQDLHHRFARGSVNFMQFQIGSATCERLARYVTEYQERGYDQFYGLPNRPRHGEGAGCSAFAASFLDIAGLHAAHLKASWSKVRRVPAHLVGGPLTGRFVPMTALLRPLLPSRWATEAESHYGVNFFDPDALFRHIENSWREGNNPLGGVGTRTSSLEGLGTNNAETIPAELTRLGAAKGFVLDAREVPVPDEAIWLN